MTTLSETISGKPKGFTGVTGHGSEGWSWECELRPDSEGHAHSTLPHDLSTHGTVAVTLKLLVGMEQCPAKQSLLVSNPESLQSDPWGQRKPILSSIQGTILLPGSHIGSSSKELNISYICLPIVST